MTNPKGETELTRAQRKALEWLRDNGPASMFPVGGPRLKMILKMKDAGYVAAIGRERGAFGFTYFDLTNAGREVLARPQTGGER